MLECHPAAVPSFTDPAGLATTILLTTLVPETTFQLSSIGHNAPHNWCVRPLLEHSPLLRFTEGCKILLSAIMGHVVILTVAMFVNNLDQDKGYPLRWLWQSSQIKIGFMELMQTRACNTAVNKATRYCSFGCSLHYMLSVSLKASSQTTMSSVNALCLNGYLGA